MKATRHDGTCRFKCEISDRFFESEAEQAAFTQSIVAEQGPNLTLDQRRALFHKEPQWTT